MENRDLKYTYFWRQRKGIWINSVLIVSSQFHLETIDSGQKLLLYRFY